MIKTYFNYGIISKIDLKDCLEYSVLAVILHITDRVSITLLPKLYKNLLLFPIFSSLLPAKAGVSLRTAPHPLPCATGGRLPASPA